jgi:hypothetical protein
MSKHASRSISRGVLRLFVALVFVAGLGQVAHAQAPPKVSKVEAEPNGFALAKSTVPREAIIAGGPARDAIHSVDAPKFAALAEATWVRGETPVIGVVFAGQARAYPIHVMEYHEVVNDVFGETPVVVSYDPLTDTALAYKAKPGTTRLEFGVSGLLYNSNFLLYDRQSESLWSQILGRALAGPSAGQQLERLPARVVSMLRWVEAHPKTTVLERPERFEIDYRHSVYSQYWTSEEVPFPVLAADPRFHPKEVILGVVVGKQSRAYLGSVLTRAGGRIVDNFEGKRIRVEYDGDTGTFNYDVPEDVQALSAYWFAWKAFHPATSVWREGAAAAP